MMKRPNLKDFDMGTGVTPLSTRDFCNYVNALEAYCDELERMNHNVAKAFDRALEIMTSCFEEFED